MIIESGKNIAKANIVVEAADEKMKHAVNKELAEIE